MATRPITWFRAPLLSAWLRRLTGSRPEARDEVSQARDLIRAIDAGGIEQRAVKQADMGGAQIGRQGFLFHRKTMVLTGDGNATTVEVFHGMIGAMVAEFHLEGFGTTG